MLNQLINLLEVLLHREVCCVNSPHIAARNVKYVSFVLMLSL